MPQYTVPQLEHEVKIVGPFTFRQFIFIGGGGAICFFLYFFLPFFFFVLFSLPIMAAGFFLAFGRVGGRNITDVLINFIFFKFSPKIYLWEKKLAPPPPKLIHKTAVPPMVKERKEPVAIANRSKLNELSRQVETKTG